MEIDLYNLKRQIIEATELAAIAVLWLQDPSFDEVNLSEAQKIAGYRWLERHIKAGNIKGTRRGVHKNTPIYYSRLEIAALKKAESEFEVMLNRERDGEK